MLGLCALVALAFTSCKKKETNSVTIKATMPEIVNNTRTHVTGTNDFKLVWDLGDVIKLIDEENNSMNFTLTDGKNNQSAIFEVGDEAGLNFLANLDTPGYYAAFYPNANFAADVVEMTITTPQTIRGMHNIQSNTYPMSAINNGNNFAFDSKAGFLYVIIGNETASSIVFDRVVLTSNKANDLTGVMKYNPDGSFIGFEGNGSVVVMESGAPEEIQPERYVDMTFVLPEGALSEGFKVQIFNGEELLMERTALGNGIDDQGEPYVNVIRAKNYSEMPVMVFGGED